MTSKKPPAARRARLPRATSYDRAFVRDWARLERAGRIDLSRLVEAMTLLFENKGPLGPEWRDHGLKGEWSDHRECHIGGDLLLIYRPVGDGGIVFVRAGTHAELFD